MEIIIKPLLLIHVLCGSISLVLFWLPVVTKKGGRIHNGIGRIYVVTMWVVVVSAFILSVANLLSGDYIAAAFLGFLSILTSAPLWYAKAILNNKKKITLNYFRKFKTLHLIIFFAGLSLVVWSLVLRIQGGAVLLLIFGILGVSNYFNAFASYAKIQAQQNWIITHLRGMLTTGIAAYTAFFAFGGRQLFGNIFSEQWIAIPWVLPTIIGTIGIRYWTNRYTRKKTQVRPTV